MSKYTPIKPVDWDGNNYCRPQDVAKVRVWTDGNLECPWNMDGIAADGQFTEECWSFPDWAEAVANIGRFTRYLRAER